MTPKQQAAGNRRSLTAIANRLENMAAEWGDIDEFNMNILGEQAKKIREIASILFIDDVDENGFLK